nr:hypothetical protein [Bradyrhizobium cenepequi]
MTVSGLRKEIAKGRLEVELIAGKQFTTLLAIARMRELCRVPKKKEAPSQPEIAGASALLIKWIVENCSVHVAHEVNKASLMQTREAVVCRIEIRDQHASLLTMQLKICLQPAVLQSIDNFASDLGGHREPPFPPNGKGFIARDYCQNQTTQLLK